MWMLDSVRVFTQDLEESAGQIIPRLQPVGGKTVMQLFGYESDIYQAKMKVVGYDDHDAIKAMSKDSATHTLSGYDFYGVVYVKSFSSTRNKTQFQTIRQDLDCEAPVFDISLELYYDG